jgi:hypothetical protein
MLITDRIATASAAAMIQIKIIIPAFFDFMLSPDCLESV